MTGDVSVVITNWNYGAYLNQAICSIAEQTLQPADWYIVDDGSDDPDSLAIYDGLEEERVRYMGIQQGAVAAYNRGLAECRTDWIVYLDADDMLAPNYLEACLLLAAERDVPWVYCDSQIVNEDGEPIERHGFPEFDQRRLNAGNYINSAALVQTELLRRAGGWREHRFEDWDLWIRVAALGVKAARCPDTVLLYRRHGESRMASMRGK